MPCPPPPSLSCTQSAGEPLPGGKSSWWSSAGSWLACATAASSSLAELNEAMALLVTDLNARPMRRLGVSRRDLFLELDHPALKPLPAQAYEYAEWRLRR